MGELCAAIAAAAPGTVVVALDHRNHGHRLQDIRQNRGWSNPTHLIDMYSTQWGTAADVRYGLGGVRRRSYSGSAQPPASPRSAFPCAMLTQR